MRCSCHRHCTCAQRSTTVPLLVQRGERHPTLLLYVLLQYVPLLLLCLGLLLYREGLL